MREEYLFPAAREAFQEATARDKERIEEIIRYLSTDPDLDPPVKEKFDVPPVVLTLYNDTFFWIVYDLPHALMRARPRPSWRRGRSGVCVR